MIETFLFNNDRNFGIYQPASDQGSNKLLIVCPPLFDDYLRCYKALVDLSDGAANKGVHVLRFDYYGTGDSFGDLDQATVEHWQNDIATAIDEGILITGANDVSLFGVRFGATLAAQIRHRNITKYIFWDPFDSGKDYLNWLGKVNAQLRVDHRRLAYNVREPVERINYELFDLNPELQNGIERINFDQHECERHAPCHVVTTNKKVFKSSKYQRCAFTNFEYNWPPYGGGVIYPKPVLEAVVEKVIES